MKKIISVILCVVLPLFLAVPVNAIDLEPRVCTIQNSKYGFDIYQYIGDQNEIISTYYANENTTTILEKINKKKAEETDSLYLETKAILLELGVDEESISLMNEKDLLRYTNAKSITTSTVYIKTDIDGNSIYIPEEEALDYIKKKDLENTTVGDAIILSANPAEGEAGTDTSEDEYMKMTLIVTYMGGEKYHFAIESVWLNMPTWRSTDSLGVCIQGHTVIEESCSGYIYYIHQVKENIFTSSAERVTEGLLPSAFQQTTTGTWSGIAAVFNLKNNTIKHSYSSYKTHIEFETCVTYPDQTLNFNVIGTYHHSEFTVDIDGISIGIDTSLNVSASIGITGHNNYTRRYVSTASPYRYEPN